jgi:hypothetical protein
MFSLCPDHYQDTEEKNVSRRLTLISADFMPLNYTNLRKDLSALPMAIGMREEKSNY